MISHPGFRNQKSKTDEAKRHRTRLTAIDSDDDQGQDVKHFWNTLGVLFFKFTRRGLLLLACISLLGSRKHLEYWPLGIWAMFKNVDMGSSWCMMYTYV